MIDPIRALQLAPKGLLVLAFFGGVGALLWSI